MAIAPRDHAKSTGLTFVYILAELCFRTSDYVILIGSTEENAAEQLSNIKEELAENDDLRREFGIQGFEKESSNDIIVRCDDGHRFRVLVRGAEQRIRGKLWNGKRPNLLPDRPMRAHLRLGTHAENMAEMAARKRSHRPVGEKNGRAKLTYAAVLEMRQLYAQGGITQAALAKRYGVPRGTVCHALSGYTWQR